MKKEGHGSGTPQPGARRDAFQFRRPDLDYGVMDELLGSHLRRAQIFVYEDFFEALAGSGITPQLFATLELIGKNPGISQGQIAAVLGIAKSGAMQISRKLEKRGYLSKVISPRNRRLKHLELTEAGRTALTDLVARVVTHDRAASNVLSAQERETLMTLLRKMCRA